MVLSLDSRVCPEVRGEMGYKVIMIDSSPGHMAKKGGVTQRNQKSGVGKCWETGGSAGLTSHPGSRTPACFLLQADLATKPSPKSLLNFVTILLLFYVLVFWAARLVGS